VTSDTNTNPPVTSDPNTIYLETRADLQKLHGKELCEKSITLLITPQVHPQTGRTYHRRAIIGRAIYYLDPAPPTPNASKTQQKAANPSTSQQPPKSPPTLAPA